VVLKEKEIWKKCVSFFNATTDVIILSFSMCLILKLIVKSSKNEEKMQSKLKYASEHTYFFAFILVRVKFLIEESGEKNTFFTQISKLKHSQGFKLVFVKKDSKTTIYFFG